MNETFEALHGYYIEDLEAGMSITLTKAFTEDDLDMYARLSTDDNPLHMNEAFAARTRVGGRVVHGMVTASLISAIVGTRLPGPGCLWMEQKLRFLAPVRVGQLVSARAVVDDVDRQRQRVRLETTCLVGDKAVLEGSALVWVPARDAAGAERAGDR